MAQKQNKGLSEIVKRALVETVTDIGQLTPVDKRELERAVKLGYLSKGRGGGFPKEKTVYAFPGYDFAGERRLIVRQMMVLSHIDAVTRKLRG